MACIYSVLFRQPKHLDNVCVFVCVSVCICVCVCERACECAFACADSPSRNLWDFSPATMSDSVFATWTNWKRFLLALAHPTPQRDADLSEGCRSGPRGVCVSRN